MCIFKQIKSIICFVFRSVELLLLQGINTLDSELSGQTMWHTKAKINMQESTMCTALQMCLFQVRIEESVPASPTRSTQPTNPLTEHYLKKSVNLKFPKDEKQSLLSL